MFLCTIAAILFLTYIFTFKSDFKEDDLGILTIAMIAIAIIVIVLTFI